MRHILTCSSVINEDSGKTLARISVCKDSSSWHPNGFIPRPDGCLKMWQAPNLVVFGRGKHAPVCGQKCDDDDTDAGCESESDDTKKPSEGAISEGSGRKKNLRGFSSKSSLSISRLLSSIDWKKNGQCVHVTLTYHHIWPETKAELQREKMALVNGLARQGIDAGIWKLEYQTRKNGQLVPHWHVLAWIGQRDYEQFCASLIKWWQGRTFNTSLHAVDIRPGNVGKASFYLCLHSAKASQSPKVEVGRWWGFVNRAAVIASVDVNLVGWLSERERVWWYRCYRRSRRIPATPMGAKGFGFSWFLPRAAQQQLSCWIRDKVEFEIRDRFNNPV